MTHHNPSPERWHALDNLRAVMMWLGIVLHVAIIYPVFDLPLPQPLPWHDPKTTLWADALLAVIHSFRMPVFFMLAGFFVVLLVHRRGIKGMLTNRLKRLGLPFVLLWPPVFIAVVWAALLFIHRAVHGSWGIDAALAPPRDGHPLNNTLHLWFLWMLMWFCIFTAVLAPLVKAVPAKLQSRASHGFAKVAGSAWGFAALALPLAVVGSSYPGGFVAATGYFLPPLMEWLHNGLFFVFGLALYAHRDRLFALYQQRWKAHAGAGLVFFMGMLVLKDLQRTQPDATPHAAFWIALAFNCCTWLWSFALLGLFLRYLGHPHALLDYLAHSAYWVYVIHFPLTIGFGACLYSLDLPGAAKIAINIAATTVVSLLSYHLLVRSTPLGRLLNGRRYPFVLFGWRRCVAPAVT